MTMRSRISTGIVMSIVCMVVASCVEKERRALALGKGTFVSSLHVLVMLPQFALFRLTEAFVAVALMEFFMRQLPEIMRSVVGSIFFLSLSAAGYCSSLVVNVMHLVTGRGGAKPWLGGHYLNGNKLGNYYYIVAVIGVINLVYFTFFANKFVSVEKENDEVEPEELMNRNVEQVMPHAGRS